MPHATTAPIDHPGSFIQEELDARGWSQEDLAYIVGKSAQQLNPILRGKQSISPDMATILGEAFDVPADFFANLQKMYDLQKARIPDPGVKTRATWQSIFPVREMIRRGWIEDTDPSLLDLQMMRFFNKNRIEDIPFINDTPQVSIAAKKTGYERTTAVQYVWLHRVRKIAEQMSCPLFSEGALRDNLGTLRAHMLDKDDLINIPFVLQKCGVRLVFVESLPSSKIDGVCVWIDSQPVIGMTLRWDRFDNFCFVLRHEIEHILRGDGMAESFAPVDSIEECYESSSGVLPECERIANEEAANFCIPRGLLDSFILRKSPFISERDVLKFAARIEINPAVVVGQIQFRTQRYAWLRKYQTGIKNYLLDWEFRDGWGYQAPTGL